MDDIITDAVKCYLKTFYSDMFNIKLYINYERIIL